MQAIILATGMGRRLKVLIKDSTKCMVEVSSAALIDHMFGGKGRISAFVPGARFDAVSHEQGAQLDTQIAPERTQRCLII